MFSLIFLYTPYNGGVTRNKKIALVNERNRILRDIAELDRTIAEIAKSGTSSASLSAGGGSKTYSRIDLASLRSQRMDFAERARAIARTLAGRSAIGIGFAQIRRS